MPIIANWYIPEQVLLTTFHGRVTAEDVRAYERKLAITLSKTPHPVTLIHDLSSLKRRRAVMLKPHPRIAQTIIIQPRRARLWRPRAVVEGITVFSIRDAVDYLLIHHPALMQTFMPGMVSPMLTEKAAA